jgi:hypothetical protein
VHSADGVAMRSESFNLSSTTRRRFPFLVCTVRLFPLLFCFTKRVRPTNRTASTECKAYVCTALSHSHALQTEGFIFYVPRSSFFGDCLLITKHRCRPLRLRRCMKRWRHSGRRVLSALLERGFWACSYHKIVKSIPLNNFQT